MVANAQVVAFCFYVGVDHLIVEKLRGLWAAGNTAIARILRDPAGAVGELKVQFTNDSMKTLLCAHIEHDLRRLDQSVQAFAR
ncbi:MAG: hypothetical protein WBP71_05185, partial [Terracidiphilus sp.]